MTGTMSAAQAREIIDDVKKAVVGGANITPSLESKVQNALAALRAVADVHQAARAEHVSTRLFTMSQAKRNGLVNLYASQLRRLARI